MSVTSDTGEAIVGTARRLGPLRWALLGLSGVFMACGVGLGVAGTLEDPAIVEQARQPQQQPAPPAGSDMASGFVGSGGGSGGGVTWPLPGLPGVGDGDETAGEGAPVAAAGEGTPVADPWSPAIFRMGFGFFVGFAMAYAMRAFVKVTMVSAGVFFLLLFGLQYAGLIEVKWAAMADRYDTMQDWLLAQVGGFRAFITGYLPSTGAALAGLGLGFIRK